MSEYQVKFRVKIPGLLFSRQIEGVEIYEAETAKDAHKQAIEEAQASMRMSMLDTDDLQVEILDIKKI